MFCHVGVEIIYGMPILFAAAPTITASGPPITAAEKKARPPTHVALGKSTRDVFTKGYGFGLIKLDLEIKSENGLEFISSGSASTEPTEASLETEYSEPSMA